MQRALVPYYVSTVVYDYLKHAKQCKKLADRDSKSIKFNILKFKTPLCRNLAPVNLYSDAGCELYRGTLQETLNLKKICKSVHHSDIRTIKHQQAQPEQLLIKFFNGNTMIIL